MLLTVLGIAGCSNSNSHLLNLNNYGSYPRDYQKLAKSFVSTLSEEPESIKYRNITEPSMQSLSTGYEQTITIYGYLVCVTYNTKNSYGIYIGYNTDGLLIKNSEVIKHIKGGEWNGLQICNDSELGQYFSF